MKRAIVVLLVAAAVLSTVFRLSAQGAPPKLSAQEVPVALPEISGVPSVPRLAEPEIEFPHSTMEVDRLSAPDLSTPKFPLTAPEIKLSRKFVLTPMERLAVSNISAVDKLRLGTNTSQMTLLSWGRRTHGSTVLRSPQSRRLVAALTGVRQSYPSMGFSNSVALGQTWSPADRITLYGGVYVSDNMFHRDRFKDLGVSGRVRLKVAERVALVGFGSYSVYNSGSPGQPMPQMMYPQNNYGGGVQLRLTDHFGIEGGVRRDFNMFTRRWETSPYILPVFY